MSLRGFFDVTLKSILQILATYPLLRLNLIDSIHKNMLCFPKRQCLNKIDNKISMIDISRRTGIMVSGDRKSQWLISIIGIVSALLLLSACGSTSAGNSAGSPTASAGAIAVVAAENFYGDIVKQIGGNHVNVVSILSDPNIDPHEYQSNYQTAQNASKAQL